MKKLLWLTGIVSLICLGIIFKMLSDPAAGILGISTEENQRFTELTVLKRNGSFEQFVTDKSNQKVILNIGTWVDASKDPDSQVFMAQTGTKSEENYLSLKKKIEIHNLPANLSLISAGQFAISLLPSMTFRKPQQREIEKIEALRKRATTIKSP
jgi:hypothetical protein